MATRKLFIATILLNIALSLSFSQNSLDDINAIFKHDFENNSLGTYNSKEWSADWNDPSWCSRQEQLKIVQNKNDKVNSSKSLQVTFPENSLGPDEGGSNWRTHLSSKYEEIYVSYDIYFMPGFQFQHGGKIPSVSGGIEQLVRPTGYDGFTGGTMFKGDVPGFYIYYPDQNIPEYGVTFLWGQSYAPGYFNPSAIEFNYTIGNPVRFVPGVWHNFTYRMVLNTVKATGGGNYDGILEAYFDGELVTQISKILFRHDAKIKIDCLRMAFFFGGATDVWRNPIEEWLKIDNVLLYTFKDNINVPRGNSLSPKNRTMNYWRNFADAQVPAPPVEEPPQVVNNTPVINDQDFVIKENDYSNSLIGKVQAYDTDKDQLLNYSIVSGNESKLFAINNQSGELRTTTNDIFGVGTKAYEISVKVTDNGEEAKSSSANVKISVIGNSTTVYIDPDNNDDLNENGSKAHPFNSWKDITWVDGNSYLQKRGTTTEEDKIVIGANNVSIGAYGDGESPMIVSETSTFLFVCYEKQNIMISDLHLESANAVSCIYLLGGTTDNIVIDHCTIEGSSNAIRIVEGKKVTLKYNTLSASDEGVFSSAAITNIHYNIFKENNTAINITSSQSKVNIYNNVFVDNVKSVNVSFAELRLYNNIFYMKQLAQKAIAYESDNIAADNNIYFPQQNGFVQISKISYNSLELIQKDLAIDKNSFTSDPMFVDVYNDNFKIDAKSPAVNAGLNFNLEKDFYGQAVPIAGKPDIGIFESTEGLYWQSVSYPSLTIYPNPSTGLVNVEIEKDATNAVTEFSSNQSVLKVVDTFGKIVFSKFIENTETTIQEEINLSGLSSGVYFIVLQMANKLTTQKLILNR